MENIESKVQAVRAQISEDLRVLFLNAYKDFGLDVPKRLEPKREPVQLTSDFNRAVQGLPSLPRKLIQAQPYEWTGTVAVGSYNEPGYAIH